MAEQHRVAGGMILVTFRLRETNGAQRAEVVGDFNKWSLTATPMTRDGDGFVAHVYLEPGRTYRFRYLLDGERWENDWSADDYVPNEFGGNDSLIDLMMDHRPAPSPDEGRH